MEILAPAKVNLTLEITAKRQDGYHELKTVMQKVDLCDRLSLKQVGSGIRLRCQTSAVSQNNTGLLPEDDRNIAFQAAAAFFERSGISAGIEITLEKRIPIAAGLGGGSSDAAAVLRGLNQLYGKPLSRSVLSEIGLTLGADVPFFVAGSGAVFASGIGELLQSIPSLRDCWILLVNPGFHVSTKWVYENFALTSSLNPYTLGPDFSLFSGASWMAEMMPPLKEYGVAAFANDLERVTITKFPELDKIKGELLESGASLSMMSGSGPTLFGVFLDLEKAKASCQNLRERYSDTYLCRPC